jgi:hypothetical protein
MSLKMTGRFHQIVYMVVLLILAVALTTALVVAAEKSSDSPRKATLQLNGLQAPNAVEPGPIGCV